MLRHQEHKTGCGFNIVLAPPRLDEDYPMPDILIGGWAIFGLGRA